MNQNFEEQWKGNKQIKLVIRQRKRRIASTVHGNLGNGNVTTIHEQNIAKQRRHCLATNEKKMQLKHEGKPAVSEEEGGSVGR